MQRALILAPGSVIEPEHLCLPATKEPDGAAAAEEGRAASIAGRSEAAGRARSTPTDLKSLERAHILETLAATGGVRKAAAERLGMSERTLRYKLAQYRLEEAQRGQEGNN
jgi:two-component system response regulator FlrC